MYKGKALSELSKKEWQEFTQIVMQQKENVDAREKIVLEEEQRLSEEAKRIEAAKQLVEMGSNDRTQEQPTTKTIVQGTIGNMPEYMLEDDWSLWYERLEQYCIANEVPQTKHVPLFLTLLGKEAYGLLRNLCSPTTPSTMTIEELAGIMKTHLQPPPSIIMERYRFKECKQSPGEEIKKYIARLKQMSKHCNFGTSLKNNLRDQFVWGLTSETIKKRLLGEADLTFDRATELALAMETASREASSMQTVMAEAVNFVGDKKKQQPGKSSRNSCYCCGRPNHQAAECRFRDYKCNKCGKVGHLQAVSKGKNATLT